MASSNGDIANLFASGEIVACVDGFLGMQELVAQKGVKTIASVVPSEGSFSFVDAFFIPSGAKNTDSVYAFINEALAPPMQAQESGYLQAGVTTKNGVAALSPTQPPPLPAGQRAAALRIGAAVRPADQPPEGLRVDRRLGNRMGEREGLSVAALAGTTGTVARRKKPYALLVLLPIGAVICLGFVVPLVLLLLQSLHAPQGFGLLPSSSLSFSSYIQVVETPVYRTLALNTLQIAGIGTILTTVLTFPVAYFIRFRLKRGQNLVLMLTLILLFAGYIVKVYTWRIILGRYGVLNTLLVATGLIHQPLGVLLFSKLAVFIVVTYLSLPVSILILVGAMQNVDPALIENARDLGASGVRVSGQGARPARHDRHRGEPRLRLSGSNPVRPTYRDLAFRSWWP